MNIARLPLGIAWSMGNLLSFLFFLVNQKLRRKSLYGTGLVPGEPGVRCIEPSNDLPGLEARSRDLRALGFNVIGDYTVAILGSAPPRGRVFLSLDGRICAMANSVTFTPETVPSLALLSLDLNGQTLVTSANAPHLPLVPGFEVLRRAGATTDALVTLHTSRLDGRTVRHLSSEGVFDLIQEVQARTINYYAEIGLYELASEADVARAQPSEA